MLIFLAFPPLCELLSHSVPSPEGSGFIKRINFHRIREFVCFKEVALLDISVEHRFVFPVFSALNAHGSRFSSRNGSNGRRFNVPEKKKMTRWPPFVQQRMLGRIFSSRSVPQTWSVKHFFWLRRKKRKYSGRSSSGGSIRNGNFPVSAKEEGEKITRNYFCWTSQMDETSVQLGCSARGRCCLALHFFSLFR